MTVRQFIESGVYLPDGFIAVINVLFRDLSYQLSFDCKDSNGYSIWPRLSISGISHDILESEFKGIAIVNETISIYCL